MPGDEAGLLRRVIVDRIPRGSRVLLLDDDAALERAIADERGAVTCTAADGGCDVVVARLGDDLPLRMLTQRLRRVAPHDHVAIVVAGAGVDAAGADGYELCEEVPLDEPALARLVATGTARELVSACKAWQDEDVAALRWLKYRLNRAIASALRLEALAVDFARRQGLRESAGRVLVLRSRR